MNLNDIRKNAYLNQNKIDKSDFSDDEFFEEKKDNVIVAKNLQDNPTVKKFTFQSISKVVDEMQNQKKEKLQNKTDNKNFQQSNNFKIENEQNKQTDNILYKVPKQSESEQKEESIFRRVAKFLIVIGEDEAAKVLPHLSQEQIEKIIPEIATIGSVSPEESKKILEEFKGLINQSRQVGGGVETAKEILQKMYGKEKAQRVLDRAMPFADGKPFEYLNTADSERVYLLLKPESVGVKTIVLSHLVPKKAAEVINQMEEEEKKEVMLRLAKMEKVSPDVIKRIDKSLHQKSLNQTSEKAEFIDGKNALAQILKKMNPKSEEDIIKVLSEDNPELGEDLRNRLFTFEDVINADDRFIQEKLREMPVNDICHLIAGKSIEFRKKILQNVSQGRRIEILEQEEILTPMRKSDCERITSTFFSILRRSYDEGHLIIKGRNDDVFV